MAHSRVASCVDGEERRPAFCEPTGDTVMLRNIQPRVFHRLFLAGVMGLGLTVAIPSFAADPAPRDASERARVPERPAARDPALQEDVEEPVRISDLPKHAQG